MAATKSEQFEHNENPADAGFLLSGDTTGVFARCIAPVPLSYRRSAIVCKITRPPNQAGLFYAAYSERTHSNKVSKIPFVVLNVML